MRAAGRRRPKDSIASERRPPPTPTATISAADPWQFLTSRDSDASFASSRPSSVGLSSNRPSSVPISDRSYQASAIRTINSFLASHSSPISLKPPLPSAKDITDTIRFVLTRLDFAPSQKLDEDFHTVLKQLNCPIKLNKSALRAPGTPHSWPSLLAVIHWLVQIAMYNDHLSNSTQTRSVFEDNTMFVYALNSYLHYIRGDDDMVDELDREFMDKLRQEKESMDENAKVLERNVKDLESKLEGLKSGPSEKEMLEKEKSVLEEDVKKFHSMIEQLNAHIAMVEKLLEEKDKELEAKVKERQSILEENEDLKRTVEEQGINARDAERMKRELQAVERGIAEAEVSRNAWEEKVWDLDSEIGHKFKELEGLLIECNQAIRRLKLGNGFQNELNPKGATTAEVIGIDYKSTLKPALASYAEDIKKSKMAKLEELIALEQQSVEYAAKIETKRNRITTLQLHIDDLEAQLNLLRKETQDYTSRCATEATKLADDVEAEAHNLEVVEKEAAEFLEVTKLKLQEAIMQVDEEVQTCAYELFALIDSVSKYKEYMRLKISEMKNDLSETIGAVSDIHKASLAAQFS